MKWAHAWLSACAVMLLSSVAWATPSSEWKVSTRNTQLPGLASAYRSKDSTSLEKAMTQLCE